MRGREWRQRCEGRADSGARGRHTSQAAVRVGEAAARLGRAAPEPAVELGDAPQVWLEEAAVPRPAWPACHACATGRPARPAPANPPAQRRRAFAAVAWSGARSCWAGACRGVRRWCGRTTNAACEGAAAQAAECGRGVPRAPAASAAPAPRPVLSRRRNATSCGGAGAAGTRKR
jgi:hypothetical protein